MSNGKRMTGSKELYEAMQKQFPKFNRITLCMINNPEYGVTLSPEAVKCLRKVNILPKKEADVKHGLKRVKQNRMTVRFGDEDFEKVKAAIKASGCETAQEFLEKIVKENINHV